MKECEVILDFSIERRDFYLIRPLLFCILERVDGIAVVVG